MRRLIGPLMLLLCLGIILGIGAACTRRVDVDGAQREMRFCAEAWENKALSIEGLRAGLQEHPDWQGAIDTLESNQQEYIARIRQHMRALKPEQVPNEVAQFLAKHPELR
jgi:glycyl-tRNA synthetase alpha subunit